MDLFGSAAKQASIPDDSDLDFLVEFEPPPEGSYADNSIGLLNALNELFSRKIDLVVSSAVKNPFFRQSIDETKQTLYAA